MLGARIQNPVSGIQNAVSRLLLVDGHAYAYRAFHAIRGLHSPAGRPTNAIYGFVQMMRRLVGAELRVGSCEFRVELGTRNSKLGTRAFTHVAVVWDGGLAAERVAALPQYKAQRPPLPPALAEQLDGVVAWLEAAGFASFCRDAVEADDWIATLARQAERADWAVVIASSDKDFMQLVSDRVGLVNPGDPTQSLWSAEQVRKKTGVAPSQIVDWLSLVGDSVDNIPGVPGVGVKTAAELLGELGSVAGLYARLGEVKSERLRAALTAAAADVGRNQALVRLKTDLPGAFSPEELAVRAPRTDRLRELYSGWGFRSLLAELGPAAAAQSELL